MSLAISVYTVSLLINSYCNLELRELFFVFPFLSPSPPLLLLFSPSLPFAFLSFFLSPTSAIHTPIVYLCELV